MSGLWLPACLELLVGGGKKRITGAAEGVVDPVLITRVIDVVPSGTIRGVNEPGDYIRTLWGVRVFQWNPLRTADDVYLGMLGNFGDLLGPLVVERMLWRRLPLPSQSISQPPGPRLFSTGSVMHFAQPGDVIWGTGVNGKVLPSTSSDWPALDIRAVRGPWTARLLAHAGLRVPSVFGDPVLLLGRLLPELGRWARTKVHDVLIVPNYNDMSSFQDADYEIMTPTAPVSTVLQAVARSRLVIGSSLHAIGAADALGIPARFVVSGHEGPFKYRDYLAGTGRATTRLAESVDHALSLGPHRPPDIDLDALERTFPWDMWGVDSGDETTTPAEFIPDGMQGLWLERIAHGDASAVIRHFWEELVPQIRETARATSDIEPLITRAADYLSEVAPEVAAEDLDDDLRRLLSAIEARDATLVRRAAVLGSSPSLAMLRSIRLAGRYLIIALVVHHPPTLSTASLVELVLTGLSTGCVVRQPLLVSESERTQWHLDLEILIDTALLGEDDAWTLALAVEGDMPVQLDVLSVGSESLGLLALERGDLPAAAPPAVITKAGTDVPSQSSRIGLQ
jgi:Polysaccharide pyruvyl transferase